MMRRIRKREKKTLKDQLHNSTESEAETLRATVNLKHEIVSM